MVQKVEINGQEVEVYTADEVAAAKTEVEGQYKEKLTAAEAEKIRLEGLLTQRAKEFEGQRTEFKRLSKEQQDKLTETELALYKNMEILADRDAKLGEADKKAYDAAVMAAITARTGGDDALTKKVREMYDLIQLEDVTPEQIAARAAAALGAVGVSTPNLLAQAGFSSGSFEPPKPRTDTASFSDTDEGKQLASRLGLKVEYTEEEKKRLGIQ